ncbi:LOW QUALITY PROTEIN: hypothetical protein PAHAL_9G473100 [Panicum hallii]|uniref:RING-type E3 ubiquitin transferase n=1 Tax=Panicum hallii TaxID=206008 RepID=A0A2S3IQR8_9POAL|nr:LOW QUALITY PROTEIN: hypothetical protein PAHAL_9G473100 [Panicum hallii]
MDAGGGAAPAPAPHGAAVSHRATSALAAVSVFLVLLCLFWRFVWQCRKHEGRSGPARVAAADTSSSAPPPSGPPRDGAGEAARHAPRTTLPAFVRVAAAGFSGAEKVDCAVCLAELRDGAAVRLVPGCGHGFHAECIEAWFRVNSTCPLCRAAVDAAAAAGQSAGEAQECGGAGSV